MPQTHAESRHELEVGGMSCDSCAARVKAALMEVDGVRNVTVRLESGGARVEGESIDPSHLVEAITRAGYGVRSAS